MLAEVEHFKGLKIFNIEWILIKNFLVTSKEYENELENENEANAKRAQDLELVC